MTDYRALATVYGFLLVLLVACGMEQGAWERIEATGVLRVGLDPTYPPFEMADGVPLQGIDVDLMNAIAADLGLQAEYAFFGYDGLYDALITGQVDVLASALVIAPERRRDFAYSEPYFNAGEILITVGTSTIQAMADLDGRTLAVELGSQGHVEATTWARRLPALTVAPYQTPDEALAAVAAGEADAALVDSVSGRLYLKQAPDLRRVEPPVMVEPYALVVRIEDDLLLTRLNESLARLEATGQLAEIIGRWLGD